MTDTEFPPCANCGSLAKMVSVEGWFICSDHTCPCGTGQILSEEQWLRIHAPAQVLRELLDSLHRQHYYNPMLSIGMYVEHYMPDKGQQLSGRE